MKVKVTFDYHPADPDPSDPTGLSEEEFERLTEELMEQLGAENIVCTAVADD